MHKGRLGSSIEEFFESLGEEQERQRLARIKTLLPGEPLEFSGSDRSILFCSTRTGDGARTLTVRTTDYERRVDITLDAEEVALLGVFCTVWLQHQE